MGNNKKDFDEQMQEIRTQHHDKKRFRLRKQEDEDAKKRLEDYLKNALKHDDDED